MSSTASGLPRGAPGERAVAVGRPIDLEAPGSTDGLEVDVTQLTVPTADPH